MIKDSKDHLDQAKESYIQHLFSPIRIGFTMIIGGCQTVLHAIIPGILKKSASDKIKKLNEIVSKRR
tara:strand:- start:305 stop:505 length:201 start_codon:yes stop_codon:yes gene_type:complete